MTGIFASLVTNRGNTPFLSRVPSLETTASHGDGTALIERSPSIRAARRGAGDDHARGKSTPHPRKSKTSVSRTRGSKIRASRVLSPTPHGIFPEIGWKKFFFERGRVMWCLYSGRAAKALVSVIPDETYPAMWRIRLPDGSLSEMLNLSRAKDTAMTLAENGPPRRNRLCLHWSELKVVETRVWGTAERDLRKAAPMTPPEPRFGGVARVLGGSAQ
jgi:hypothetical protein